jgi:hypothetical protein
VIGKELSDVRKWVVEDMKDAQFSLNSYIMMRNPEMINYWRKVMKYFRDFVSNISVLNIEQIKNDYKLGDEAEKYASELILCRLGVKT